MDEKGFMLRVSIKQKKKKFIQCKYKQEKYKQYLQDSN